VSEDGWTQEEADAITRECGAPARWLQVVQGELRFQPDADGDYNVSVCVLQALKASGKTKIGIIGSEAVREDEGQ
jgi:hypothetical protein